MGAGLGNPRRWAIRGAVLRQHGMTPSQLIRFFRDPTISRWRKWAGLAALAYVLMPVDLVPDVLPVIGWLDDLGVVAAFVANVLAAAPRAPLRPPREELVDALPLPPQR